MIVLSEQLLEHLEAAARRAFPDEACGFLIGRREDETVLVEAFARSPNRARDPARQFLLDPAMHLRLQRELRGSAHAVVGLYHSHPGGRAEPSAADLGATGEPFLVWLILALDSAAGPVVSAAFRLPVGGAPPERLEIRNH